jgi:hypothetical protein
MKLKTIDVKIIKGSQELSIREYEEYCQWEYWQHIKDAEDYCDICFLISGLFCLEPPLWFIRP